MNQTGYAVLKIPKNGAAFAYAKEAREYATGATGAGGYLHATATAEQWSDVRFVSAIGIGSSILPVSMGASISNVFTGVATVIGGTTPIGDLRSEDGPYVEVAVGSSSVHYIKKNQEYEAAFYATYIGGTNSSPTKIGVGTTAGDITTYGYFEGSFTTNDIHEFQTSFTADSTDLSKITTGSGVYTEGADITLQFNILNRNGEQLSSAAQIAADPFVSGQKISILNTDGTVAFADYRIGGDSTFSFSSSQNIDVFGTFTRNFGIRNEVVNQDGGVHTSEFYLYANTATFDKVFVSSSGQTVLNETYSNHNPPNTGSITSAADRADAIKYFNNQPINDSGVTGFIEFDLGFNESPNFTSLGDLVVFYGTSGDFTTNRSSLAGNFPLNSVQEGQRIRLTANDGIPEGTGLFFKLAADTEVGFNEELFNVGPFTLEPEVEGPDLNLYNQGDQSLVGDFTIEGGLEGDDANGGNLNVSGNALGTGIGGRLTGPDSKMYLLSGDEAGGGGTDTLQTVTARGNTTVGLDVNFQDILYVDHTNTRVGIGTINPQTPLHVESDSFFDGNVGIGTSNPTQKLDVDGIITSKGLQTNTTNTNYNLISRNSAGNSPLYVQSANSNTDQPIAFFSYGSATANAGTKILKVGKDKSYFDNTNVGIGSTNPTVALDVAGAGKFTSQVTIPATPSASTDAASKGYVDAQVGSADTLQEVTDNGNTTTNNIEIQGSAGISFNSNSNLSIKPDTVENDTLTFGVNVRKIEGQYVAIGSTSNTMELFPTNSVTIGAGGTIVGSSPATGSAILAGTGNAISGHFNTLVGGAENNISGDLFGFNFIGGGSGIDVVGSQYSSSVGGKNNDVSGADHSVILGGNSNYIVTGQSHFLGGGSSNRISGTNAGADFSNALVGGTDNEILNCQYSFIGAGASNTIFSSNSVIGGGNSNIASGDSSVVLGGTNNYALADKSVAAGSYSKVQAGHGGAFVFSDSNSTPTLSTGANTMVLNFAGGVHVPTSGVFGEGLFVSGVPVLTGENNPAEADTLQTVTTRGNTTSTSILSTGPHISGVTGLYSDNVGIGTNSPDYRLDVGGNTSSTSNTIRMVQGNDGTAIRVGAGGLSNDVTLLRVDGGGNGSSGISDTGAFGFSLKYMGSRAGNLNSLSIFSDNQALSQVEAFTILQDGKVGIGTTDPSETLDVAGNIFIGANDLKGAANCKIEMDAADGFTLTNPNNAHGIDIVADDLTFFGGGIGNRKITTNAGDLSIDPTADLLLNETAGNVGIGTNNPTERVEVSGSLLLGPRSSSAGDTMPFLKIDGYDEHGIEMGWGTWTKWKITTKVNGQLEIYNTGIQHQKQQVSIGRQDYHEQGNIFVYSTGSVLRAGHNGSVSFPILDIGVQDAPAGAGAYRGDAYIDVRASTSTPSRFHFKRDGEFIASGVSVSGDVLGTGVGNRITNNGVPYLLSGDSPAETQTLQDVCDNGNTTTTSVQLNGGVVINEGGSDLDFRVEGDTATHALFVNGADNHVGIGTATPISDLTVYSSDSNTATVSIHNINNNETGSLLRLVEGNNHMGGFLQFDGSANKFNIGVHSTNDTTFANDTKAITIDRDTANVGVGTQSPDAHLNVYNTGITSSVADVHIVGSGNTYGLLYERLRNDSLIVSKSTSAGSYFKTDSATPSFQGYEIGTNWFLGQYGYNDFRITDGSKSGGTAALTIQDSTQNVGIGTTSPLGKLHVKSANAGSFTYDTNADDLIVESNANGGIAISTAAANTSRIIFASPDDPTGGEISFNQTAKLMKIGPTTANGLLALQSANGVETMRLDASNNVGIGTTSPSFTSGGGLQITHATQANLRLSDSTDASYNTDVAMSNDDFFLVNRSATGHLKFRVNNSTEAITVLQDGNVGIGVTNPSSFGMKLEVAGGGLKLDDVNFFTTYGAGLAIQCASANEPQVIIAANSAVQTNPAKTIFRVTDNSFNTPFLNVVGGGNVGIGTNSPYAYDTTATKLHVKNAGSSGSISEVARLEGASDADGSGAILRIGTSNDRGIYLEGGRVGSVPYASIGTTEYNGAKTEGIRIDSSGKVGIGTTIPSAPLDISSSATGGTTIELDNTSTGGRNWTLYSSGSGNSFGAGKFALYDADAASVRMLIDTSGNVGIGTTSPSNALDVVGHFSATSKSFLINHPTKKNKKLQYASLEGPENGVYVRGTTDTETIELPEYWSELVHEDSITVVLTPIGKKQDLFIKEKSNKLIKIGGAEGSFDYVVYGERKDIDKLEIEPLKV